MIRAIVHQLTKIEPLPRQLGRWCHPAYNELCDVDRKADLANSDNSAGSSTSQSDVQSTETRDHTTTR